MMRRCPTTTLIAILLALVTPSHSSDAASRSEQPGDDSHPAGLLTCFDASWHPKLPKKYLLTYTVTIRNEFGPSVDDKAGKLFEEFGIARSEQTKEFVFYNNAGLFDAEDRSKTVFYKADSNASTVQTSSNHMFAFSGNAFYSCSKHRPLQKEDPSDETDIRVDVSVGPPSEIAIWNDISHPYKYLFGVFYGDRRAVYEILLDEASGPDGVLTTARRHQGGRTLSVLKANIEGVGKYEVWLDDNSRFVGGVLTKQVGDAYFDGTVGPDIPFTTLRVVIDSIEHVEMHGVALPVAGSLRRSFYDSEGKLFGTTKLHIKLREFLPNPPADKQLDVLASIPNGSEVLGSADPDEDDAYLPPRVWQDGKIVLDAKKIDLEGYRNAVPLAKAAREANLQSNDDGSGLPLLVILGIPSVLIIAGAIGLVLFKRAHA